MLLKIFHCWIVNNTTVDILESKECWYIIKTNIHKPFSSSPKTWYNEREALGSEGWRVSYQPYEFPLNQTSHLFLLNGEQNKSPAGIMERGGQTYVWRLLVGFLSQMYPFAESFSPSWTNGKEGSVLTLLGYGISRYENNPGDWEINGSPHKRFGLISRWGIPE